MSVFRKEHWVALKPVACKSCITQTILNRKRPSGQFRQERKVRGPGNRKLEAGNSFKERFRAIVRGSMEPRWKVRQRTRQRFDHEKLATTNHNRTRLRKDNPQGKAGKSSHNNSNLAQNSCYGNWKVNGDFIERWNPRCVFSPDIWIISKFQKSNFLFNLGVYFCSTNY